MRGEQRLSISEYNPQPRGGDAAVRNPKQGTRLQQVLTALEAYYGRPRPLAPTDPLGMIVWENVVYLADDDRRAEAFEALREYVGIDGQKLKSASRAKLRMITGMAGIVPDLQVEKLKEIGALAVEVGDFSELMRRESKEIRKTLKRFPAIGDPGAEKIMMYAHAEAVLALESNGMRVLARLYLGAEDKSYSKTYKTVQAAAQNELSKDCDELIRAHELLRVHGKTLCKRTTPKCELCPVRAGCRYTGAE